MLVLVVGDIHIPERRSVIPAKFRELLVPGKIQHVLCTGNVTTKETIDFLRNLAGDVHVVRGESDPSSCCWPDEKLIKIGNLKIGLTHGHQHLPWGCSKSIESLQRALDADIMITGHTHCMHYREDNNSLFINPGSLTGSRTVLNNNDQTPSFMLLDINGSSVVTYTYQLKNGEVDVSKKEFQKA